MPFLLAHGEVGALDELFFFLAVGIFLVMLVAPTALTLIRRSRGGQEEDAEGEIAQESATESSDPAAPSDKNESPKANHFRLD